MYNVVAEKCSERSDRRWPTTIMARSTRLLFCSILLSTNFKDSLFKAVAARLSCRVYLTLVNHIRSSFCWHWHWQSVGRIVYSDGCAFKLNGTHVCTTYRNMGGAQYNSITAIETTTTCSPALVVQSPIRRTLSWSWPVVDVASSLPKEEEEQWNSTINY